VTVNFPFFLQGCIVPLFPVFIFTQGDRLGKLMKAIFGRIGGIDDPRGDDDIFVAEVIVIILSG
jgi:hypothetical protein